MASCRFAILLWLLLRRRRVIRAGSLCCARRFAFCCCCSFFSDGFATYDVDDMISDISRTIEFAEAGAEEFGVTEHPTFSLAFETGGFVIVD